MLVYLLVYLFIKLVLCVTYMFKPWFIVVWFLAHERLDREEDTEKTLSCTPGRARPRAGGGRGERKGGRGKGVERKRREGGGSGEKEEREENEGRRE